MRDPKQRQDRHRVYKKSSEMYEVHVDEMRRPEVARCVVCTSSIKLLMFFTFKVAHKGL